MSITGEEKLNRAIDEIRAVETEKRENCVQAERRKQEELQASIEQLRQVCIYKVKPVLYVIYVRTATCLYSRGNY